METEAGVVEWWLGGGRKPYPSPRPQRLVLDEENIESDIKRRYNR